MGPVGHLLGPLFFMKHTENNSNEKVVLSKGTRKPSGHSYEIYADNSGFFLIVSNSVDLRSEMFKIDIGKFPILERAVDEHIDYLGW
jgi:hypothetical protein